jgi:hypothetical protein
MGGNDPPPLPPAPGGTPFLPGSVFNKPRHTTRSSSSSQSTGSVIHVKTSLPPPPVSNPYEALQVDNATDEEDMLDALESLDNAVVPHDVATHDSEFYARPPQHTDLETFDIKKNLIKMSKQMDAFTKDRKTTEKNFPKNTHHIWDSRRQSSQPRDTARRRT